MLYHKQQNCEIYTHEFSSRTCRVAALSISAIIFLHRGYAEYLSAALRQARLSNPDVPIFFLGDPASIAVALDYAECFDIREYLPGATGFVETYVHLSHNDREFTCNNIARWMIIRDFSHQRGLSSFVHLDSDVMLFAEVNEIAARWTRAFGAFDIALSLLRDPISACGNASLWNKLDRLDEFCAMVQDIYTLADSATFLELVAFHQLQTNTGVPDAGLVSDMILFGMFKRRTSARIIDSGAILEDATLDHNINLSQQDGQFFVMADGKKQLAWRSGTPYGVLKNGASVRFDALHYQGNAKRYIVPLSSPFGEPTGSAASFNADSLVRAAYRVIFERKPDTGGLRFWTSKIKSGLPPLQFLRAMVDSKEFENHSFYDRRRWAKGHLVLELQASIDQLQKEQISRSSNRQHSEMD